MATIASTIEKFTTPDTSKQREQYTFLLKAAQAKMALYKSELNEMFLNPEAVGKVQIVGNRAFAYKEQYHIGLGKKSDVVAKIGESIGDFLKGDTQDITKGILNIAAVAVDAILGNVSIGECEDKQFFVIPQHNAIIRIDTKCWRYNFSSTGIITDSENIFCYVCCKSVVDHKKLTDDEFTYLISEYVGDDPEKVVAYAKKLREIWNALKGEEPKKVMSRVNLCTNLLKKKMISAAPRLGCTVAGRSRPSVNGAVARLSSSSSKAVTKGTLVFNQDNLLGKHPMTKNDPIHIDEILRPA